MLLSFLRLGKFSSLTLLNIRCMPLTWDSYHSYVPIIQRFHLFMVSTFPVCPFPVFFLKKSYSLIILPISSILSSHPNTLSLACLNLLVRLLFEFLVES